MDAKANKAGKWAGGRIQEGVRGTTYWIEKSVGGQRYSIRLKGIASEPQAVKELLLFQGDPVSYLPPETREELKRLDVAEAEAVAKAAKADILKIDAFLIEKFTTALLDGYDPRGARTEAHIGKVHRCLSAWSTCPAIKDRDFRQVTLGELLRQLDEWHDKKARIAALKALTKWMRSRDLLKRSDDPTLDLACIQARKPTPAEREAKVYPVELLELTYGHIGNQDVRDLFWLRVHCGLHESEVKRIAKGECVIRKLDGQGKIAAVVEVQHKSREPHRQAVDAPTLARIERIMKLKTWPTEKTLRANRERAAAGARIELIAKLGASPGKTGIEEAVKKVPEVYVGNLRATRTTLAEEFGTVVLPKAAKKGVPLELIARTHGHSPSTAAKFYSGRSVPPMVVVPVRLVHANDPP